MFLHVKRFHMVGIGGSGMSGLAHVLHGLGFEVTGIDSSPVLVGRAQEHAQALSLNCHFQIRDVFDGPQTMEKYDALFLSQNMYSTIPTRQRRIDFLRKTQGFLRDAGVFYIEFLAENGPRENSWKFRFKKRLALLCNGNRDLEEGDRVWIPGHYFHLFTESEVLKEIQESGFKTMEVDFYRAYAILTPKK